MENKHIDINNNSYEKISDEIVLLNSFIMLYSINNKTFDVIHTTECSFNINTKELCLIPFKNKRNLKYIFNINKKKNSLKVFIIKKEDLNFRV